MSKGVSMLLDQSGCKLGTISIIARPYYGEQTKTNGCFGLNAERRVRPTIEVPRVSRIIIRP